MVRSRCVTSTGRVKVKRYRTVDCIVIGVTGESHAPRLVLGLRHTDNAIHHLGRLESVICT